MAAGAIRPAPPRPAPGSVPVAERVSPTADGDVDVRFVALEPGGLPRLLGGMALANRPWRLVPAFRSAAAASFGAALYALVNTSIWRLGEAFGWTRLGALTFLSLAALVAWVMIARRIVGADLRPGGAAPGPALQRATALTVTAAVLAIYGGLFTLVSAAALVFVPPGLLADNLRHPVGSATTRSWDGS